MIMKVYINGWDGPWGWRSNFYEWAKTADLSFDLVCNLSDADIIFQTDLTNWKEAYSSNAKVIANVLDFGEWLDRPYESFNEETVEYVMYMKRRGAKFTAISRKVIDQLKGRFDIGAKLFIYPSQVIRDYTHVSIPDKKKIFISFCRLMDPGKAINEAILGFEMSGLHSEGWRYMLFGPERPNRVSLPKGVLFGGYANTDVLHNAIKTSAYVVMPSYGEGLGLPAIEGMLLGTPFISRNIRPVIDVFGNLTNGYLTFDEDEDMLISFHNAKVMFGTKEYVDLIEKGRAIAFPWVREIAFESLCKLVEGACCEN